MNKFYQIAYSDFYDLIGNNREKSEDGFIKRKVTIRKCLRCRKDFDSSHSGNRLCTRCARGGGLNPRYP